MRAGDGAEDRDDPRRKQKEVDAEKPEQDAGRIRAAIAARRLWASGSTTKTITMKSAQRKTIASIHQTAGSANRRQRSSRHVIQSPVAPASGIDNRTCAAKRLSIASNSAQPFSRRRGPRERQRDEGDEGDAADPMGDEQRHAMRERVRCRRSPRHVLPFLSIAGPAAYRLDPIRP